MLVEIHMLKNYPATNLNRDDNGAPKTCEFGGVTRGRISSQCLKRSWRSSDIFKLLVNSGSFGIRTRKLPELVCDKLRGEGYEDDLLTALMPKISKFGQNKDKDKNKANKSSGSKKKEDPSRTTQIMFYSEEDIQAVCDVIKKQLKDCKTAKDVNDKIDTEELQKELQKDAKVRPVSIDIALFGRMVTSDAFRNVEASMQVAHAVSTNRVVLESDYFTAVDDLLDGNTMEESGAGLIQETDYNSSCYYIYASLDTGALRDNLCYSDDADKLVKIVVPALLKTIAFTNPSGKQNSFAGNVLPSAMLVEMKTDKIPVSYVNAFAEPSSGKNLVRNSISKLAGEVNMIAKAYELPVEKRFWFCVEKYDDINSPDSSIVCNTFNELVENVESSLD